MTSTGGPTEMGEAPTERVDPISEADCNAVEAGFHAGLIKEFPTFPTNKVPLGKNHKKYL